MYMLVWDCSKRVISRHWDNGVQRKSLEGYKKKLIRDLMVNVILLTVFQTMLSSHAYLLATDVIHS